MLKRKCLKSEYNVAPAIEKNINLLKQHFETYGKINELDAFFKIYIIPSFKPEEIVVAYQSRSNTYYLEHFASEGSIRSFINQNEEINSKSSVAQSADGTIHYPVIVSLSKKRIERKTIYFLRDAIDYAVDKSHLKLEEFEGYGTYIDGTSLYFYSSKEKCARHFPESLPGPAENVIKLESVISKFLVGKATEQELISNAEYLLKH